MSPRLPPALPRGAPLISPCPRSICLVYLLLERGPAEPPMLPPPPPPLLAATAAAAPIPAPGQPAGASAPPQEVGFVDLSAGLAKAKASFVRDAP